EEIERVSPWRYSAPLAPDLAARRENRSVDFEKVVEFSRAAARDEGTLLIEGIGGIMVPLDDQHTVLDWMAAVGTPTVLVAGSYLGSISHTLTCLEVLRQRGLLVRAVVVNETPGATVTVADTVASVTRFARPIPVLGLQRSSEVDDFS